jgi:hypothetical protein
MSYADQRERERERERERDPVSLQFAPIYLLGSLPAESVLDPIH